MAALARFLLASVALGARAAAVGDPHPQRGSSLELLEPNGSVALPFESLELLEVESSATLGLLKGVLGPARPARAIADQRPREGRGGFAAASEALCHVGAAHFSPFGLVQLKDPDASGTSNATGPSGAQRWQDVEVTPHMRGPRATVSRPDAREWLFMSLTTLTLLAVEFTFLRGRTESFLTQLLSVGLWIVAAVLMACYVDYKGQDTFAWTTGYLLEWMLSVDNLFVFHMVCKFYGVPKDQLHKALYMGILGAVLMRLVFFYLVADLLQTFQWIRVPFGLLLIWSGIETIRSDGEEIALEDTRLVRFLRGILGSRLHEGYDEEAYYVYVYIHICVYIYIYIHIHIHTNTHLHIYIYIYIHIYTDINT